MELSGDLNADLAKISAEWHEAWADWDKACVDFYSATAVAGATLARDKARARWQKAEADWNKRWPEVWKGRGSQGHRPAGPVGPGQGGGKAMTQKVVHGADVWGWDTVPRSELVALACMSPHSCEVFGCPGPVNKHKLGIYEELLDSLIRLVYSDGGCEFTGDESQETCPGENDPHYDNKCPWCQASAAIAKATGPQAR